MLHQIEYELIFPDEQRLHPSMGSLFHGLFMQRLGRDLSAVLHDTSYARPFSQGVYFNKKINAPVWRINTVYSDFDEIISPLLMSLPGHSVFLEQKLYPVTFKRISSDISISYKDLLDDVFMSEQIPHQWDLRFITTTSFKRDGYYVIMPELDLIFRSLISRWNNGFNGEIIDAPDLNQELSAVCRITKYNLQSNVFSVDGSNIYGFNGMMRLRLCGNDMQNRIMALLLRFANFSGIGVKTALGMGLISCQAVR